jgi:uncharacterized protein YneF (UPF0154 family)
MAEHKSIADAAASTVTADDVSASLVPKGAGAATSASSSAKGFGRRVFRMLALSCVTGLLAIGAVLLGLFDPPENMLSPRIIVMLGFVAAAQAPTVTAIAFALTRKPRVGLAHMICVAAITILICGGLITGVRVVKESEMSELCENAKLRIVPCSMSVELITAFVLLLIGTCAAFGAVAGFFTYRVYLETKERDAARAGLIRATSPSSGDP